jgi:hypothetical protein
MRASEKIESDARFLQLFSTDVLDMIVDEKGNELMNDVIFVRSSPGSGKTSLLRIFEPSSINMVYNQRTQEDFKELFSSLKKLDVLDSEKIKTMGVLVRCTRNYEILEDINYDESRKIRLFNSLFNARIVLSTLKSICVLKKLNFPNDLNQIKYSYQNDDSFFKNNTPCTGRELFEWATNIERKINDLLDSFLVLEISEIEGHNELFTFAVLHPKYFKIKGQEICENILFMIDDAHKLSTNQRESFFKYVIEKRGNSNIWISERLERISNLRSYSERDYNEINLEKYWGKNAGKFKNILNKIAEKRAAISTDDVHSFSSNLENNLDEEKHLSLFEESIENSKKNINFLTSFSTKFQNWVDFINRSEEVSYKNAVFCKEAEILVQRNIKKNQLTLDFPLGEAEFMEKRDSNTENAAKLFLARDSKLPYYFGFNNLVTISSNNIEQFISFASELFEGMLSNKISGHETLLSSEQQEKIIIEVVKKKWNELQTLLPESDSVIAFLQNLGEYCHKITHAPTASYAPGISGFAIQTNRALKLIPDQNWEEDDIFLKFKTVLNICLAFNLLEIRRNVHQGLKGQTWDVYYLNRWLCIKYNLPLNYGGWNKLTPKELYKWIKN